MRPVRGPCAVPRLSLSPKGHSEFERCSSSHNWPATVQSVPALPEQPVGEFGETSSGDEQSWSVLSPGERRAHATQPPSAPSETMAIESARITLIQNSAGPIRDYLANLISRHSKIMQLHEIGAGSEQQKRRLPAFAILQGGKMFIFMSSIFFISSACSVSRKCKFTMQTDDLRRLLCAYWVCGGAHSPSGWPFAQYEEWQQF